MGKFVILRISRSNEHDFVFMWCLIIVDKVIGVANRFRINFCCNLYFREVGYIIAYIVYSRLELNMLIGGI